MPSFAGQIPRQQVWELVSYVRSLSVDGRPYTIVGVLPAAFTFPATDEIGGAGFTPEFYLPKAKEPGLMDEVFGDFDFGVIARLRPGMPALM